jgi:hypothetical protein
MIKYFITAVDDKNNEFKVWLKVSKTETVETDNKEKCLLIELEETNVPTGIKI